MGHIVDYEKFLAELTKVWKEVYRVLVPGGRLVLRGPGMFVYPERYMAGISSCLCMQI